MNKVDLMKELLERYEQRDSMIIPCSQMIMDQYIKKLEITLMIELGADKYDGNK